MSKLKRVKLKAIIMCSFQRSEKTNLALFREDRHYPGDLQEGEAFLLVSKMGNQVIFIFRGPSTIEITGAPRTWKVLDSRRLRLEGGTWSPYMLQNYANSVGINLVGLKRLEQIMEDRKNRKRR